jgi:hypothetical protein
VHPQASAFVPLALLVVIVAVAIMVAVMATIVIVEMDRRAAGVAAQRGAAFPDRGQAEGGRGRGRISRRRCPWCVPLVAPVATIRGEV